MLVNPVMDPPKPMAAGAGDELRAKNRNADYLPYDRNRVMLTPIPGRDYSAYINASFIEGKYPTYNTRTFEVFVNATVPHYP